LAHAKAHLRPPTPTFEPSWEVRAANEADMRVLALRLSSGSLDELAALTPFHPLTFLLKDFERKSVIVDRANPTQPVAVLDLAPLEDKEAAIFWSALTERLITSDDHCSFSVHAQEFLNHFNRLYPVISTLADARNVRHSAWLERIGFTLAEELPQYGRKELPFLRMTRAV
jgi:hypothetical protein